MNASQGTAAWWLAGLTLAALSILALAGARDLTSSTEQLARLESGNCFFPTEPGLPIGHSRIIVTLLALCWAAAIGLIWAWLGWRSSTDANNLMFRWHGLVLCLTTIVYLTVDNLLILCLTTSLHLWIGLVWWRHQQQGGNLRGAASDSTFESTASMLISSELAADFFNLLDPESQCRHLGTVSFARSRLFQ